MGRALPKAPQQTELAPGPPDSQGAQGWEEGWGSGYSRARLHLDGAHLLQQAFRQVGALGCELAPLALEVLHFVHDHLEGQPPQHPIGPGSQPQSVSCPGGPGRQVPPPAPSALPGTGLKPAPPRACPAPWWPQRATPPGIPIKLGARKLAVWPEPGQNLVIKLEVQNDWREDCGETKLLWSGGAVGPLLCFSREASICHFLNVRCLRFESPGQSK